MTDETKVPEKRAYRKSPKKTCAICGEKYSKQGMTSHLRKHEREAALQHANEITHLAPTELLAATVPSSFSIVTVVSNGEITRVAINKMVRDL